MYAAHSVGGRSLVPDAAGANVGALHMRGPIRLRTEPARHTHGLVSVF